MGKLENKVVLITGGTTGIGSAAARLFAAEGAKVTVTGISPQTLAVASEELRGVAEVVAADAGSSADIASLAKRFEGGLDVLFVNAGIANLAPLASLDEAAFDETFRVNVRGPWLAMKYLAPLMRKGGSIVVTGSINGLLGMPGTSAYGPSKAALRALVRTAANELAPAGIRVNSVAPGPIETPLYAKLGMPATGTRFPPSRHDGPRRGVTTIRLCGTRSAASTIGPGCGVCESTAVAAGTCTPGSDTSGCRGPVPPTPATIPCTRWIDVSDRAGAKGWRAFASSETFAKRRCRRRRSPDRCRGKSRHSRTRSVSGAETCAGSFGSGQYRSGLARGW